MAGSVIAAALITGLNSDLPGQVVAQVTEDVYDTATGRFLLIPQGTRLIGKYDSHIAYGQERLLLIWMRLLMPDGSSIVLDNLPATDTEGYAGLEDGVNYHTWRLLKGVVLSSLLGISSELAANNGTQSNNRIIVGLRDSVNDTANQAGQRIVSKDLATPADADRQARVSGARTCQPRHRAPALSQSGERKIMTKLKLGPIRDDKSVRLTIILLGRAR